jgi:AraC-like DNA-binding protein
MRRSSLSLAEIAAEVGFYDLPHLDKAFRRRRGMTPQAPASPSPAGEAGYEMTNADLARRAGQAP